MVVGLLWAGCGTAVCLCLCVLSHGGVALAGEGGPYRSGLAYLFRVLVTQATECRQGVKVTCSEEQWTAALRRGRQLWLPVQGRAACFQGACL